ncbi:hypothetical protein ACFL35_10530 [Candidatus Riflebacteria bacterium]
MKKTIFFLCVGLLGPVFLQAKDTNFTDRFNRLHSRDLKGKISVSSRGKDRWKIYKTAPREWNWKRTASNGRIVGASSEAYKNKKECIANAKRHGYLGGMQVLDKWKFYKDKRHTWRWKRIARNGRIVGASTEGYHNRKECFANAERNGYEGKNFILAR